MRITILIILNFICFVTFAQTSFLKDAAAKFDKALIAKDTVVLKQLLHKDLTYGHSNAWVEKKQELIDNIISGKLVYHNIESKNADWKVVKDVATVRNRTNLKYTLDGKKGELILHVLQVWIKSGQRWQLLSRQSAKLEGEH